MGLTIKQSASSKYQMHHKRTRKKNIPCWLFTQNSLDARMGAQKGFLLNSYSRRFSAEFQGLGKILEYLEQGVGTAELTRDGEGGPSCLFQPEQFHSHLFVFQSSISWHKRILHLKYLIDQSISTPELETKKYKWRYLVRYEVLC